MIGFTGILKPLRRLRRQRLSLAFITERSDRLPGLFS
jgi:hypothetical protein